MPAPLRAFVLLVPLTVGCSGSSTAPAPPPSPRRLAGLPISLTVDQRTTTPIPGSHDEVLLTVDDITRGQVMASLSRADGRTVLAPRSLQPGESAEFVLDDVQYLLHLKELRQSLVGTDAASFEISIGGTTELSEAEKIERLIAAVESLQGAEFLRNGTGHSPQEAAAHLQQKRRATAARVTTARAFVDEVASKSSITGEEYQIRLPDGRTVTARTFFDERLAELESTRSSPAKE
ncbi:MAG TPA: DUF5329 family protein [Planctomycetaceae bacterium]|nr:DUF5329 family protein [Planctomycetaceae bacterium]